VNAAWSAEVALLAERTRPTATLQVLEAIGDARRRLPANVTPLLALEAMLVSAVLARTA
jgi:DNA polymerase-3 subunit delta'